MLGPVEVRSGSTSVEIRRGIPRLLLSALILRAGETVSPDWLAEVIWGDDAPGNPTNALQTHVSYLRRTLAGAADGSTQSIVTRPGGYVLDVPPERIDSIRFVRGIERARRQGEVGTALGLTAALDGIEQALALWRGEPYVDAGDRPFIVGEVTRLVEARLTAVECRVDYLLALGRHQEAVAELGSLVVDHPLRERFHEQLILGLYRSGRQGDALRAYQRARTLLLDELGLDPGPALQRLELLMLEQSGELDWGPPPEDVPIAMLGADGAPTGEREARPPRRGRLPSPVSRLIGREEATVELRQLLGRSRLVTLTGPGGVGKTALAAEVARNEAATRDVWFVDLGGVHEDDAVPMALAMAVGTPMQPGRDLVASLGELFAECATLIVVDTCEHVLSGSASLISQLLSTCSDVGVLATSRRPLGVRGERVWPVTPLALPSDAAPAAEAMNAPSMVLFAERAVAARPDFVLTETNAADVAAICTTLDGLPLAIELAAAQTDAFSPSVIQERLSDRFALLVDGGRDASRRQQTLRSTLEWSFNLLSPDERRLFVRLSVFTGPFGLDEVVTVAGPELADSLRLLAGLVRQSMVAVVGEDLYRLLDTPREYGREILAADPDAGAIHERHARLYVEVAERAADGIWSRNQRTFVERLRASIPNLRAAIEWSLNSGQEELAARIVGALSWFFMLEGMFTEGLTYLARVEAASDRLSRASRARIAYGAGLLAAPLGRLVEAKESCERSVRLSREGGALRATADSLAALSVTEWALGDFAGAAAHQEEAIELYSAAGDPWRHADVLVLRARTALDQRDPVAREWLEQAVALATSVGDHHAAGMAAAQLSQLALDDGDPATAARLAEDALVAHEALAEPEATIAALHLLGQANRQMGDLEGARAHHERALRLAQTIGHVGALCESVEDFAALAADEGDVRTALRLLDVAERERRTRSVPHRRIEADRLADLRRRLEAQAGGVAAGVVDHLGIDTVIAQLGERRRRTPSASRSVSAR